MPEVYVGVGSNVDPEVHVREAVQALGQRFGELRISSVYRTDPVGFQGEPFLNLVIMFSTDMDVSGVGKVLDDIEICCGRKRTERRFGPRSMDLDLLLYGDTISNDPPLPRPEILQYGFVLGPLSEIAGELVHPGSGKTYARLWDEKRDSLPTLEPFSMRW